MGAPTWIEKVCQHLDTKREIVSCPLLHLLLVALVSVLVCLKDLSVIARITSCASVLVVDRFSLLKLRTLLLV